MGWFRDEFLEWTKHIWEPELAKHNEAVRQWELEHGPVVLWEAEQDRKRRAKRNRTPRDKLTNMLTEGE